MLMSSDAVVFHGPEVRFYDSPKWRAARQKWVFWSQEPPPPVGSLKRVFNWTMTYRSDSDIWNPYGIIAERKTKQSYQYQQTWKIWRRKSRMAAWAVSRCEARSRREDYVKQLRKYVRVNVYGKCGQLKCPRANSTRCYEMFEEKYFFYLSFENSICRDYVTEKFFNVLEYDIVPVVLGGANYTAIAPPDSFIDALSFKSPKHLAEYLKRVAGDFQLYAKYLRWKETHTLANFPRFDALCRVCKKLHSPSFRQTTVVADMFHWWNTMSHCWSWNFTN
ncbi:hypothetical protein HPB48_017773 [Haemaphysalis longicornis]|uniref:Fucosyltransferase n=1 Tax=Haemaphysalis longicornis TaxID=44386 RepID=A0A9J6FNN1_HAELO|nr:hypothetical protein HPB48_017773 [Haemaphysalis longicornis]